MIFKQFILNLYQKTKQQQHTKRNSIPVTKKTSHLCAKKKA